MPNKNFFIHTFFNAPWNIESFLRFDFNQEFLFKIPWIHVLFLPFISYNVILISCKVFKLEQNRSWNNDTSHIIFTLKVLSPKKTFLYGMSKKDGSLSASFWERQSRKSRSHMITRLAIWSTLINMPTNRISFKGKGNEKEASTIQNDVSDLIREVYHIPYMQASSDKNYGRFR